MISGLWVNMLGICDRTGWRRRAVVSRHSVVCRLEKFRKLDHCAASLEWPVELYCKGSRSYETCVAQLTAVALLHKEPQRALIRIYLQPCIRLWML